MLIKLTRKTIYRLHYKPLHITTQDACQKLTPKIKFKNTNNQTQVLNVRVTQGSKIVREIRDSPKQ